MQHGSQSQTRRTLIKGLGAGGALGLAGCLEGSGGGGLDEITFGQPAILSGPLTGLQEPVTAASEIVMSHIEEEGGPGGAEVEMVMRDTELKPEVFRQVITTLVENDNACAMPGGTSGNIVSNWDLLQDSRTPLISWGATTTYLNQRGGDNGTPDNLDDDEWVWRTQTSDSIETFGVALALEQEMGIENIGIMHGESPDTRSFGDALESAWEDELGHTVTQRLPVQAEKADYSSELSRFFEEDFDAWALALVEDSAITLLNQWDDGGYGGHVVGSNTLKTEKVLDELGDVVPGMWFATPNPGGPAKSQFDSEWQEAGNSEDAAIYQAIAQYDNVHMLALAAHRAFTEFDISEVQDLRDGIQKSLGPIARPSGTEVSSYAEGKSELDDGNEIDYQGASTNCNFTKWGNVIPGVLIDELTADGYQEVTTYSTDRVKQVVEGTL